LANIILPHSEEAEDALLGCVMVDNSQVDRVLHYVPEDSVFYSNRNKVLWGIMQKLRGEAKPIDMVTIMSEVPDSMKNGSSNIGYHLSGLPDKVASPSMAPNYARTMYEKWLLRNLIIKSKNIEQAALNPTESAMHHLEELYNSIGNALDLQTFDNFVLDDLILNTVENLYAKDNVIPFGIDNIDKMVGGMTRGEISIIAGRPGHFKSTMMINVVSNLIQQGYKVLVMNREMSNIEMMKKFMVMEAKHITYDVFRAGTYSKEHKEELKKIVEVIRNKYKNLIMYDNIMDLSGAMREIRKHKPDVVVDDYIGLVNVKGIDDNRLKIDSIMKQYKWACKNNNMCALLLSQLNRKCEERTNKRPLPSDLRESGSIEQDAEMILFMYYEWRYLERESTLGEYGLEVVIGKNRYGRTGSVVIGVSGNKCKMYETPDIALASSILKEEK